MNVKLKQIMDQRDTNSEKRVLEYNSDRSQLALPEYGRNIQQMVNHCLTIEDREERTRCAYSIVQVMGNIVPQLRDEEDSKHILWDHLAIMSDFKLDIDYPYEIINQENLKVKPEPIAYGEENVRYRHYGKIMVDMIKQACTYEEGDERDELIMLIANHMKKVLLSISKDGVEDARVFNDLREISGGKIDIDPEKWHLHEFKEAPVAQTSKKSKKKK